MKLKRLFALSSVMSATIVLASCGASDITSLPTETLDVTTSAPIDETGEELITTSTTDTTTTTESHTHSYTLSIDGVEHVKVCSCGSEIEREAHSFELQHDEKNHWGVCACGKISQREAHVLVAGDIITPATSEEAGSREYTCSVCEEKITKSYTKNTANISYDSSGKVSQIEEIEYDDSGEVSLHTITKYTDGEKVFQSINDYVVYSLENNTLIENDYSDDFKLLKNTITEYEDSKIKEKVITEYTYEEDTLYSVTTKEYSGVELMLHKIEIKDEESSYLGTYILYSDTIEDGVRTVISSSYDEEFFKVKEDISITENGKSIQTIHNVLLEKNSSGYVMECRETKNGSRYFDRIEFYTVDGEVDELLVIYGIFTENDITTIEEYEYNERYYETKGSIVKTNSQGQFISNNSFEYIYDEDGAIELAYFKSYNEKDVVTSFEVVSYDEDGKELKRINAYEYEESGITYSTTEYTFDSDWNVLSSTKKTYDRKDKLISVEKKINTYENGYIAREDYSFIQNGELKTGAFIFYDENYEEIDTLYYYQYSIDSKSITIIEAEYDEKYHVTKRVECIYTTTKKLISKNVIENDYNEDNDLVSSTSTDYNEDGKKIYSFISVYDGGKYNELLAYEFKDKQEEIDGEVVLRSYEEIIEYTPNWEIRNHYYNVYDISNERIYYTSIENDYDDTILLEHTYIEAIVGQKLTIENTQYSYYETGELFLAEYQKTVNEEDIHHVATYYNKDKSELAVEIYHEFEEKGSTIFEYIKEFNADHTEDTFTYITRDDEGSLVSKSEYQYYYNDGVRIREDEKQYDDEEDLVLSTVKLLKEDGTTANSYILYKLDKLSDYNYTIENEYDDNWNITRHQVVNENDEYRNEDTTTYTYSDETNKLTYTYREYTYAGDFYREYFNYTYNEDGSYRESLNVKKGYYDYLSSENLYDADGILIVKMISYEEDDYSETRREFNDDNQVIREIKYTYTDLNHYYQESYTDKDYTYNLDGSYKIEEYYSVDATSYNSTNYYIYDSEDTLVKTCLSNIVTYDKGYYENYSYNYDDDWNLSSMRYSTKTDDLKENYYYEYTSTGSKYLYNLDYTTEGLYHDIYYTYNDSYTILISSRESITRLDADGYTTGSSIKRIDCAYTQQSEGFYYVAKEEYSYEGSFDGDLTYNAKEYYDANDDLIKTLVYSSITDNEGYITEKSYTYDENDNCTLENENVTYQGDFVSKDILEYTYNGTQMRSKKYTQYYTSLDVSLIRMFIYEDDESYETYTLYQRRENDSRVGYDTFEFDENWRCISYLSYITEDGSFFDKVLHEYTYDEDGNQATDKCTNYYAENGISNICVGLGPESAPIYYTLFSRSEYTNFIECQTREFDEDWNCISLITEQIDYDDNSLLKVTYNWTFSDGHMVVEENERLVNGEKIEAFIYYYEYDTFNESNRIWGTGYYYYKASSTWYEYFRTFDDNHREIMYYYCYFDKDGNFDPEISYREEYTYHGDTTQIKLRKKTTYSAVDEEYEITTREYDASNELISKQYKIYNSDGSIGESTTTYESNGDIIEHYLYTNIDVDGVLTYKEEHELKGTYFVTKDYYTDGVRTKREYTEYVGVNQYSDSKDEQVIVYREDGETIARYKQSIKKSDGTGSYFYYKEYDNEEDPEEETYCKWYEFNESGSISDQGSSGTKKHSDIW